MAMSEKTVKVLNYLKEINGENVGIYKDTEGKIYAVKQTNYSIFYM